MRRQPSNFSLLHIHERTRHIGLPERSYNSNDNDAVAAIKPSHVDKPRSARLYCVAERNSNAVTTNNTRVFSIHGPPGRLPDSQ